jgi:hypothetical protein
LIAGLLYFDFGKTRQREGTKVESACRRGHHTEREGHPCTPKQQTRSTQGCAIECMNGTKDVLMSDGDVD